MGDRKPNGYWTLEKSLELAATCESRFSLRKKSLTAWRVLRASGDLERLWPSEIKPYGYWTVDRAVEYARQFASRNELRLSNSSAYRALQVNGLLEQMFPVKGDHVSNWIYVVKCCKHSGFCYGGITKNYKSRFRHGSGHCNTGPVYEFMKEHGLSIEDMDIKISKHKYQDDKAARAEKLLIAILRKNNSMCVNRNGGGQIGVCAKKWTKDVLLGLVREYPTRLSLLKGNNAAYIAARRYDLLDEMYGPSNRKKIKEITYEQCEEVAALCETRAEMKKLFSSEYRRAFDERWLDELLPPKIIRGPKPPVSILENS